MYLVRTPDVLCLNRLDGDDTLSLVFHSTDTSQCLIAFLGEKSSGMLCFSCVIHTVIVSLCKLHSNNINTIIDNITF